jgi:hypothetical protein
VRRDRLIAVAAAGLLVATCGGAHARNVARPQTTNPLDEVDVFVQLRDRGISVKPNSGNRGAAARFIVFNVGTKVHSFTLAKGLVVPFHSSRLTTGPLKPHNRAAILYAYLDVRGEVHYSSTVPGDVKRWWMRGTFTIV